MQDDLQSTAQMENRLGQGAQDSSTDRFAAAERFITAYDFSTGYGLYSEEHPDHWIPIEFGNERVQREFYRFFSNENLTRYDGKVIYCDCVGERDVRQGVTIFRVVDVRFFAR